MIIANITKFVKKGLFCIRNYITAGWTLIEAEIRIPDFFRYADIATK